MKRFVESMDDFSGIWEELHGATNRSKFQPFTEVATSEELNTLTEEGIDIEHVLFNPNGMIDRYVYWNGPVFVIIHGIKKEMLQMTRTANVIEQQEKRIKEAMNSNNWHRVFSIVEKKILIVTYKEFFDQISDNQKYSIFVDLYVRSESGFDTFGDDFLKKVFSYKTMDPEYNDRMQDFDKDSKANLQPDGKIKVYHGMNGNYNVNDEMSWTLSRKTASFFANRFTQGGKVMTKNIKREAVQDYYNSRGEKEVIVFPKRLMS